MTVIRVAQSALLALGVFALSACSPTGETEENAAQNVAQQSEQNQSIDPVYFEGRTLEEEAAEFRVLVGGTDIGALEVTRGETGYSVDFAFSNNGRGPVLDEEITLGEGGRPTGWRITGNTTFGNAVDESFGFEDDQASWRDTTGEHEAVITDPAFYVPQEGSPYMLAVLARALMQTEDLSLAAIPNGSLRIDPVERISVGEGDTARDVTAWALSGTDLNPTYFLMDGQAFFGVISPGFAILEAGYEGDDERLRGLAAGYAAERYNEIFARVSHDYDAPVRIRDVRLFDPATEALTEPVSVLVEGQRIVSVDAANVSNDGEVLIDGDGGTLVPGLYDMHGHMGEQAGFLNIAAGITGVRDMGNNNDVLSALVARIEAGEMAGPRVFRSGFIEGRSPFSSNNGIIVETEEEAVAAVHTYADMGVFHQIKIYNSMSGEWVPAMVEAARERGLRVTGHVPAFSTANQMIEAGYDEMTHINQVMLGWVLDEGEDTRSLLRLTALRRLPPLDLQSEPVQYTINAMAERGVSIDPTLAIHEALLLSRNGQQAPGVADFIDHMPVSVQRQAMSAWAAIETPEDDANYRGAFDQVLETVRMMHEAGIFLVPGTDLGGSFYQHRELELYQRIGMSPAEILAWGSQGMADYLGVGDELGSIEPGKLADFFLVPGDPTADFREVKTISMVVADGRFYYPEQIYPEFGIRPFVEAPSIAIPAQ
ncbi:MAG: amidohydrolase family protein [Alphaproteobacteria bacterium]|nr:amidohydrolase family protein [Alphaproteobacteria bacterium]